MLAERLPYDDPVSESWPYNYAMIRWSAISYWLINGSSLLLYWGLYLAGEQLGKPPTAIILLKHVLETLCVLWIHGEI